MLQTITILVVLFLSSQVNCFNAPDEEFEVTPCEACKATADELEQLLNKSKNIILDATK